MVAVAQGTVGDGSMNSFVNVSHPVAGLSVTAIMLLAIIASTVLASKRQHVLALDGKELRWAMKKLIVTAAESFIGLCCCWGAGLHPCKWHLKAP